MESPLYTGSRALLPIAEIVGIPVDQLNYVVCQLAGIVFGLVLRLFLSPNKVPPKWRSMFCFMAGFASIFFMIGWAIWQVLLQVAVCYILLRLFTHHRYVGVAVFIYAMGHLLTAYIVGLSNPFDQLCYDPTYNLMITTQKLTSLAFSLVDWGLIHGNKGSKIQEERKKWAVKSMPSVLDFLAFTLSFQGALAGPFCHFNIFMVYIHGKDTRSKEEALVPLEYNDHPPTVARAMISKLAAAAIWMVITVRIRPLYPDSKNVDPDFITNTSMPLRIAYLYVSLFMDRCKYYITWILADVVCNASGMGYTGQDENGKHTWVGMSNVRIWKIETATSLKLYLDNWNISTTTWLRHVCYMRAPILGMYLTFVLSSLWHGLYSGYYVTFLSATIFVAVGRKIRAAIRPMFQGSKGSRLVYEVLTFFGTQISLAFLVLSFVVLDWSAIVRFHNSFYWFPHVSAISLFFLIPSKNSSKKTTSNNDGDKSNSNHSSNCRPVSSSSSSSALMDDGMSHRLVETLNGSPATNQTSTTSYNNYGNQS